MTFIISVSGADVLPASTSRMPAQLLASPQVATAYQSSMFQLPVTVA